MVKNKWQRTFLLLPMLFLIAWCRGTAIFIVYDWVYLIPALLIFLYVMYLLVWLNYLRFFLTESDVGAKFLNSLVTDKVKVSIILFVVILGVSEMAPLIAYPFFYVSGVCISLIAFSKYRGRDVLAVKDLLLKGRSNQRDIKCYQFFCGEGAHEYVTILNDDEALALNRAKTQIIAAANQAGSDLVIRSATEVQMITGVSTEGDLCKSSNAILLGSFLELNTINPATGMQMIGGIGSVDVQGNPYGANEHY